MINVRMALVWYTYICPILFNTRKVTIDVITHTNMDSSWHQFVALFRTLYFDILIMQIG